jgi:hypothetical protein
MKTIFLAFSGQIEKQEVSKDIRKQPNSIVRAIMFIAAISLKPKLISYWVNGLVGE